MACVKSLDVVDFLVPSPNVGPIAVGPEGHNCSYVLAGFFMRHQISDPGESILATIFYCHDHSTWAAFTDIDNCVSFVRTASTKRIIVSQAKRQCLDPRRRGLYDRQSDDSLVREGQNPDRKGRSTTLQQGFQTSSQLLPGLCLSIIG